MKTIKYLKFTVFLTVFFLYLLSAVFSKEIFKINSSEITKHGLDYAKSYVMGFTKNSKYLLIVDKERNPELIKQGQNTKILVIPINNPKEKFLIYTPAYKIENYINFNENEILLIVNNSTSILKLDLEARKVVKEYKLVEKGKEGIRLKAGFYCMENEKDIYLMGSFFNKDQIFEDPNYYWIKTEFNDKINFTQKVTNITEVENKVGKVRMFYWSSPYSAVFTKFINDRPSELYYYTKGNLNLIDVQYYIFEIALYKQKFIIYPYSKDKESLVNYLGIYDIGNNKKFTYAGLYKKPLVYPFVNNNGLIIIATLDMEKKQMDFYFTSESENMIFHRFIAEYPAGSFKISDENFYSLQTKDFISVGKVEKTPNEKSMKPL
ncbi:MAG: hypothetical protein ACK4ZM_03435 [bacterium]